MWKIYKQRLKDDGKWETVKKQSSLKQSINVRKQEEKTKDATDLWKKKKSTPFDFFKYYSSLFIIKYVLNVIEEKCGCWP